LRRADHNDRTSNRGEVTRQSQSAGRIDNRGENCEINLSANQLCERRNTEHLSIRTENLRSGATFDHVPIRDYSAVRRDEAAAKGDSMALRVVDIQRHHSRTGS
jgi:hypothetical protein